MPFSIDSTKVFQRIKSKIRRVKSYLPPITSFSQRENRPRSPPLKEWPLPPEQLQRSTRAITLNWQRRSTPGRSGVYGRVSCVALCTEEFTQLVCIAWHVQ